ncbi:Planctomycete cytochrome C [Polystyrenella longa]|uniref:Planctomycete cytochrome C n=1 Tax=Polystyrenella longa TaxID=2528007 RepID=A0A518CJE2_9PLAN|nr:PSD1 and planctomycete cytochrome C domain-containing protein [Polystyrenella longa]QDU79330.1 Planctomycete cytochrome C [Polystyrenella longa]
MRQCPPIVRSFRVSFFLLAAVCLSWPSSSQAEEPGTELLFERDIRPILKEHCIHCHGEGGETEGGLDVRLQRFLVKGGDSGEAIDPGKPDFSYLVMRLDAGEMPPDEDKLLPQHEIDLIKTWIAQGAKTARPEPEEIGNGPIITEEERNFWSFLPVQEYPIPEVAQQELVSTPIDAFIVQKLESEDLTYSYEADKRTLIRRATFDLTGLPPTPAEINDFLNDESPEAFETVIDRLLASPEYGERWGRHWLDVAGYADSEGYTIQDPLRDYAYKYRNYVIDSFNNDIPYNQFITEQLAGDELAKRPLDNTDPETIRLLTATGFLRMAPDGTGSGPDDADVARNEVMSETINIVSTSIMGITVGCAQCHDHKYDPIPQTDYYEMRAIFEPALDCKSWKPPQGRRYSLYTKEDYAEADRIEAEAKKVLAVHSEKQTAYIEETFESELKKLPEEIHEAARLARKTADKERTEEQKTLLKEHPSLNVSAGSLYLYNRKASDELKKIAAEATEIRAKKPFHDYLRSLIEPDGHVPPTHLFYRGDIKQPKEEVQPASLTVLEDRLEPIPVNDEDMPTTGRRLAFARQLTSGEYPLVPRVIVNRIWMHHMGRGLVDSPADFGKLGSLPTHPELLDWLATDFMNNGWKIKRMHKMMMLSQVYQQSSARQPQLEEGDPDNKLYARMSIRRLAAEDVRDSLLAISNQFTRKQGGTSVPVREDNVGQIVVGNPTKEVGGKYADGAPLNGEEFRRSVYIQVRRSTPLALLETFDAPRMQPNCTSRNVSTVTPQALMLMNNNVVHERAVAFAERLENDAGEDRAAQVNLAYQLAWGLEPTESERNQAIAFIEQQTVEFAKFTPEEAADDKKEAPAGPEPGDQALASFCHALFSANRFLYID